MYTHLNKIHKMHDDEIRSVAYPLLPDDPLARAHVENTMDNNSRNEASQLKEPSSNDNNEYIKGFLDGGIILP
ncbi:unnamed protein product [Bursaphelenchus okinawaensis]|uniref:Uncharacterized protein n=1 Tax=Bursaphelenchus okinawaensis TaxID=465554 RepID=A0A811LHY0_9BILA|nr:unnamed protein product [Bursaphelenchus okinawaensis]CAG9124145.1 unnamed protein product [Bursaphelenchus okinawaensis]